ncbi:MAG TPA: protein kinase, partial [Acidothermaceae bacterium]
ALRSVVSTTDGLVLVLDYAEGGSLAAVLGVRGRLSTGEVVAIGAPLGQALAEIHARGLTHGDVTPGNIVFDRSGKPLLADLGVANLIGEQAGPAGRTPGLTASPTRRSPGRCGYSRPGPRPHSSRRSRQGSIPTPPPGPMPRPSPVPCLRRAHQSRFGSHTRAKPSAGRLPR